MTARTFPHPRRTEPPATPRPVRPPPRDILWTRMVERWRATPETQEEYDARQW